MPFDVRTLVQTTMLVWLLSTLSLVFIWWKRKTYPGFGFWTLEYLAAAVGLQLISLRDLLPPFITVLAGNGLLFIGALMGLEGVKVFFARMHSRSYYLVALITAEAGLAWFYYITPDINVRVLLASFFIGVISFAIAKELLFRIPDEMSQSSRFTGVVMAGHGTFMIFRGLATTFWAPLPAFFTPSIVNVLTFAISMTVGMLGALGFIMMNNQRMENEIIATRNNLQETLTELKKRSDEIRVLSGLLPICASCKRIKDDKGSWIQMERYIRDHSAADFSHGICPECSQKLYPELHRKK